MKLRLKGNSLRLRLGRSEVSRLLDRGRLEESTTFGGLSPQRFVYALTATAAEQGVSAGIEDGCVSVRVSIDVVRRWATTDELAISGSQPSGDGGVLRISIEKDLVCLDPASEESQEDAFPHPQSGALCTCRAGPQELGR